MRGNPASAGARPSKKGMLYLSAIGLALAAATPASAAHELLFSTTFTPLNAGAPINKLGINPSATAQLSLNPETLFLNVMIQGTGFEPGIPHVAHIHGNLVDPTRSGSGALDSFTPTLAQDVDGDRFIELFEGLQTYGPILFDFDNIDPDLDGVINFNMGYDLTDPSAPFGFINPLDPSQGRYGITDLLGLDLASLDLREIVIHGLTVPPGIGIDSPLFEPPTDDEINGRNIFAPPPGEPPFGFTVVFPVASGELSAVPEPGTWAMMLLGFGAIGFSIRRSRRNGSGLPQIA